MRQSKFPILILLFINGLSLYGHKTVGFASLQDTLKDKQELYNGSIWIDNLSLVKGDQFLFSREFMPGSVTIRGKTYRASVRYDIYEDELQIPAGRFGILRVNKEVVDSFSLEFNEHIYRFIPLKIQNTQKRSNFFNIISRGPVSLYVSYQKKINKSSSGGENARFYQTSRLYLVKDDAFNIIKRKKALIGLLEIEMPDIRSYIRENNLKMTVRRPESFEPLIRHYNSLSR